MGNAPGSSWPHRWGREGKLQEEDITIVNIYAPNIGAPQYIRQALIDIKGETDSNTIVVGGFNTPLTPMDRSSKEKINKETQGLNDTSDQIDLIDIYRAFPEKAMAPHSSTLAWKIPWMEEPGGLQSMGSQRIRLD